MATQLNIINSALILCGQRTIQSLNENTADVKLIEQIWEQTEESVIRSAPWTSATKRLELALLPDAPAFQYNYMYEQPADCVRILECYRDDGYYDKYLEWRLEGKQILSNQSPLYTRYTFIPTDKRDFDALLVEAISLKLAANIAYTKTESKTLSESLDMRYERALGEAKSIDSLQSQERWAMEEIPWLDSRETGLI